VLRFLRPASSAISELRAVLEVLSAALENSLIILGGTWVGP